MGLCVTLEWANRIFLKNTHFLTPDAYQGVRMFVFRKIWLALFSCNTNLHFRLIMDNMYFQTAVNLICTFSFGKLVHVFLYITFSCVLLPSTFACDPICLFVRQFVPLHKVCEGIVCLTACCNFFVHLSASGLLPSLGNLVIFVVNIITILVKLLQMIQGYIIRLVACQLFLPLCLHLED